MRSAIWGLAALMLVAVACGSGRSPAHAVAPTRTGASATSAAIPTPTVADPITETQRKIDAAPVLAGSSGWLIYTRGPDLFVGDLASGSESALTHGSLGSGYAGDATIDGTTWLYYFSITDSPTEQPSTAVMLRRRFGGDAGEQQLFTFHPSNALTWARDVAAVSPDGTRIAYAADDGLHVRTLASREDTLLLQNMPMPADRSRAGFHYDRPLWSPAGRWLLVMREPDPPANAPNEGPLIIDPSVAGSERDLPIRGNPVWSPDGLQLCGDLYAKANLVFPGTDIALYSVSGGQVRNLTSSWFANASLVHSFGPCAWAPNGTLASGYDIRNLQLGIAVLDTSGREFAALGAGAVWPDDLQWLPDTSGVILTTLRGASLAPSSSVVLLDGSLRRLQHPGYVVGTLDAGP